MKCNWKGVAHPVALVLLLCGNARADWTQSSDPLVVKVAPVSNQVQLQNPPDFTWARHPAGASGYTVEITSDQAPAKTITVDRNWYLPEQALPNGNYTWRVRPTRGNANDWSAPRSFQIDARAVRFEVPDNATLRDRIRAKARPRSLPSSFNDPRKMSELAQYRNWLQHEVEAQISNLRPVSDAQLRDPQVNVIQRIEEVTRQMEAAAVMWRLSGDNKFLREALRRGDELATLDSRGPTGFLNQDQATRQIALSLVKTVDMLAQSLGAEQKSRWMEKIAQRTTDIYNDLAAGGGRLDQNPLDSHANTALAYLTLISVLSLGDIPAAQTWFDFSFRAYAHCPYPWSGPEGGSAQGTAYAEYAAAAMLTTWDALAASTGINLYAKPWTIGFLDYMMQFTPPGARTHTFGDNAETTPNTEVTRGLASRMVSPRAAWYVEALGGTENALTMLLAPYPLPVTDTHARIPPANSASYPSIGWVAMHSDIAAKGRTSLFFKSSPFGSFNHSHGDQNGLQLTAGGQPLLIKAGYFDGMGSNNWTSWYHQTKSQNAITFDGGKGQNVDGYAEQLMHNGKITAFSAQPKYDYAEGDATAAYGGALTMARRQVWYLRDEDVFLVRDKLKAPVPHVYEFNLHAPASIDVESRGKLRIAAGSQVLCVRSLEPATEFRKVAGGPPKPGRFEDHAAFTLANDGTSVAEFLVLLDVGCKRPQVTIDTSATPRRVIVGTQAVELR